MSNYLDALKIKPNIKTHKLVDIIIPENPIIINPNESVQNIRFGIRVCVWHCFIL